MHSSAASRSAAVASTSGAHAWGRTTHWSRTWVNRPAWKVQAAVLGDKALTSSGALSARELQRQEDEEALVHAAFPTYLQNTVDDFCAAWDDAIEEVQRKQSAQQGKRKVTKANPVWQSIRKECIKDAAEEPLLSSFLYASILSHDTFERSLAFVLANRLADTTLLPTELFEMFHAVLHENEDVTQAALADIIACRERDPACTAYGIALLYYKGYHAVQTARIAHVLWNRGQKLMALMLQSRINSVFAIDIHPAAQLGKGILLDHGTGVVIGETAVVGNNVSLMQNVTLGGTGKESGNRHPKIEENVLIGAGAKILGAITVGRGSQVAAGSLVLKPVAPRTMVAGSPATQIGTVSGNPALKMQHWERGLPRAAPPRSPAVTEAVTTPQSIGVVTGLTQSPIAPPASQSNGTVGRGNGGSTISEAAATVDTPRRSTDVQSLAAVGSIDAVEQDGVSRLPKAQQRSSSKSSAAPSSTSAPSSPAPAEVPQRQGHMQGLVEAVVNDRVADMKWPEKPDPEYFI